MATVSRCVKPKLSSNQLNVGFKPAGMDAVLSPVDPSCGEVGKVCNCWLKTCENSMFSPEESPEPLDEELSPWVERKLGLGTTISCGLPMGGGPSISDHEDISTPRWDDTYHPDRLERWLLDFAW